MAKNDYKTVGDVQEAQGWSDDTLLRLALEYILEQGLTLEFVQYLKMVAAEENAQD